MKEISTYFPSPLRGEGEGGGDRGNHCHPPLSPLPSREGKYQNLLFEQARRLTRQRFGHVIQFFAPLYVSNECVDICAYCGFSRENQISRRTLTPEEVVQEADYLAAQGFSHLLLVSGEDPRAVTPAYLAEILQRLRGTFAQLAIEVAPFPRVVYEELKTAGLDRVVIYQETYDREAYARVHRAGPKRNYAHRLQAPREAAEAGIRQIGMGVLLGLAEWRADVGRLIEHVRELKKHYWQTEFTVSFPRLRPCHGGFAALAPVSDEEYKELIASVRVALPDVGITLSTRESPELRQELLRLGVTQISAGSRTNPGGYELDTGTTQQFEIADHRTPVEVAQAVIHAGLEPVWKDWEAGIS